LNKLGPGLAVSLYSPLSAPIVCDMMKRKI
jgi:hypothetical protein